MKIERRPYWTPHFPRVAIYVCSVEFGNNNNWKVFYFLPVVIEWRPTDVTDSVACENGEIVTKKRVFTTDDLPKIRLMVVYAHAVTTITISYTNDFKTKDAYVCYCKFVLNFAEATLEECK